MNTVPEYRRQARSKLFRMVQHRLARLDENQHIHETKQTSCLNITTLSYLPTGRDVDWINEWMDQCMDDGVERERGTAYATSLNQPPFQLCFDGRFAGFYRTN